MNTEIGLKSKESPEFRNLSQIVFAVVDKQYSDKVLGTGFFIAKNGWGLTALHVTKDFLKQRKVPILYQGKWYEADLICESNEHDIVALHVPEIKVEYKIKIASSKAWEGGDPALAIGYHRQERMIGPNPMALTIDQDKPARKVRIHQQWFDCLVLSPNDDVDNIGPGASGGPVYNKRTRCIIGVVIGTEQRTVLGASKGSSAASEKTRRHDSDVPPIYLEAEINLSNYGFVVPFDELFPDWGGFQRLIDSNEAVLWEDEEPTEIDIFTPPIADFPMVPVPPDKPRFEMSVYLVTNRQYEMFLAYNEYWQCDGGCLAAGDVDANYLAHWRNGIDKEPQADQPVINISYYAARAYVEWFSKRLNMPLDLPSRTEWELAAFEGKNLKAWRKAIKKEDGLEGVNCYDTNGRLSTVGKMGTKAFKLCDILGLVYEFCAVDNPDSQLNKVLAIGGSYRTPPEKLIDPVELNLNECRDDVGFRFVHRIENS